MVGYKNCSVKTCRDKYSSRHSFPNPTKYPDQFSKWVEACGDARLGSLDPNRLHKNFAICHLHFAQEDRSTNMYLKKTAVPTLNLTESSADIELLRKRTPTTTVAEAVKMVEKSSEVTEQEIQIAIPEVINVSEVMNDVSSIQIDNIVSEDKLVEIKAENLTPKCFNKICRVCLKQVEVIIKYSTCYFNEKSLSYYLKKYTGVDVDLMNCNGIQLPETICTECMTAILKFDEFAQNCQTSDEKLKEITNQVLDNDHDYISTRMDSIDENLPTFESNKIATNVLPPKVTALTAVTNIYSRNQKQWTCQICGIDGIRSIRYLRLHNIRKHNVTPIIEAPDRINDRKCNICSKIYKSPGSMREHMRVHTNEKPFQCEICGVKFKTKTALRSHKYTHDENKNVQCELCGKAYKNRKSLRYHHKIMHIFQETICEICGKSFKNKVTYRYHMNRHKDIKILCPICNKYINKLGYRRHRQAHAGFKCRTCHFSFASSNRLERHEKVHSGINPYKCRFCNKRFNDPLVKAEHMELDCRKKIHVCQICKKAFSVEGNLRVHMRIHTGDLPYECDLCNEKFNFLRSIKAHYAKFHKNECIENKVFVKNKTN